MEQNNNATPLEQPIESVSCDVSADSDVLVTSYGTVTRNDVESLIKLNSELGQVKKKKSVGKRALAWFFGIVGGMTFLVVCAFLCIAAFKMSVSVKPHSSSPNTSDSPTVPNTPYDEDFFQIPNIFGNDDAVSGSDQSSSKTSDAGLGILVTELDKTSAGMYDINGGLVILTILEPTSFSGTNVREYDIITAAEGIQVTTTTQLANLLNKHRIGDDFTLTITRFTDGFADSFDVTVTLIDKNASQ